jgi:hypothetical protein
MVEWRLEAALQHTESKEDFRPQILRNNIAAR